jgi:hypothetical protein
MQIDCRDEHCPKAVSPKEVTQERHSNVTAKTATQLQKQPPKTVITDEGMQINLIESDLGERPGKRLREETGTEFPE